MKKLIYALSMVFLSTTVSHGGTKVHTDYDREMSFSDMRTYAWTEGTGAVEPGHAFLSPLLEKRIQDAVDQTLATKDMARQPDPDDVAKYARKAVQEMFKKFPPEGPRS